MRFSSAEQQAAVTHRRPPDSYSAPEPLRSALEVLNVPGYIVDRDGVVRWANAAACAVVERERVVGLNATDLVAPEHHTRSREMLQKKLLTAKATHFPLNLITPSGRRVSVSITSAPLEREGEIMGAFGLFTVARDDDTRPLPERCTLTSRQHELLTLLNEGASTSEIATKLGLSEHTVRNHIRQIMRRLGANSRIAAVAIARKHGLLTDPP